MIAGTQAEYQSNAESTKDTPYFALKGELWGVFCEYFWESWWRYNRTALHYWTQLYWRASDSCDKHCRQQVHDEDHLVQDYNLPVSFNYYMNISIHKRKNLEQAITTQLSCHAEKLFKSLFWYKSKWKFTLFFNSLISGSKRTYN